MPEFRRAIRPLGEAAASVVFALLIGAALLAAFGYNVIDAFANMYDGVFGNVYSVSDSLIAAMPLLFAGLAVAFPLRAGLFNIGAEGQLHLGALAAAVAALPLGETLATWGWPGSFIAIALSLLAGALAGAAWAFIPGYLKARTGAHEVIACIMMNYIGILLTAHLVKTRFKAPGSLDQTPLLPEAVRFAELIPTTRLTGAIFLGVALAALFDWLLRRTALGYDVKAMGLNPGAAEYAGVPVEHRTALSMALGGAAAGLAGSVMILAVFHRFIVNFSPGYGYAAIAVAVAAKGSPWGVIPASLLFGALQSGGMSMQLFAGVPSDMVTVVQGLVILLVSAPGLIDLLRALRRRWPMMVQGKDSREARR